MRETWLNPYDQTPLPLGWHREIVPGILNGREHAVFNWPGASCIRTANDPRGQIGIGNMHRNADEVWNRSSQQNFDSMQDLAQEIFWTIHPWMHNILLHSLTPLPLLHGMESHWKVFKIQLETVLTWCRGFQEYLFTLPVQPFKPYVNDLESDMAGGFQSEVFRIHHEMNRIERSGRGPTVESNILTQDFFELFSRLKRAMLTLREHPYLFYGY